ncbi:ABC transporter permease [Listeria monocytogenes]|uniref:ABC transporter permease n=1 Tax=Listeria innocua TaxID=1642 RepID=UPI0012F18A8F|nr:ABC transporter permease [Listeria innocua]EAF4531107.1 ABC transporter permease [Listeria monocytogenes serotype 1/2a]ECB9828925.1 ABC transporter permease [Listeria monocytogenes]MBC1910463.1 ABC transporter permease [Listeria innocua]MBC1928804.1 ABC transporter permease [Listeria innocua]
MKSKIINSDEFSYNTNYLFQLYALIRWSLVRYKVLLPVFTIAQLLLSLAIVYGLAFLIPTIDQTTAIYLSSGATSLGIIAVGCVLAAQIVSTAKQDGIVSYQRTLPVSRINILIADFLIWGVASLPGVLMSFLASSVKFNLTINFSFISIFLLILSQMTMISIGFCIAYWLPSNGVSLMTQIIMIGGLLFSPITYPADRLPEWTRIIYEFLPFVTSANILRSSFFGIEEIQSKDLLTVCFWLLFSSLLSLIALSRRN